MCMHSLPELLLPELLFKCTILLDLRFVAARYSQLAKKKTVTTEGYVHIMNSIYIDGIYIDLFKREFASEAINPIFASPKNMLYLSKPIYNIHFRQK